MPNIKILDKNIRELIAAGEVVERPASVVKELVENAIDAKASCIEVEIKGSGLTSIRVSDNGCGIDKDEIKTAFIRHATSKISSKDDLFEIKSLGFRGEALAAISAVSKIKLTTKPPSQQFAYKLVTEGGEHISLEETGAPDGTTFIVNDLFYNTPARMKFLKTDSHEAGIIEDVVEQQALAHPDISFSFIKEGKLVFKTQNDGSLYSSIYMIIPKQISENLLEVKKREGEKIVVFGYTAKPEAARKSRAFQFCFINGRFVKSKTVVAAVEQAYSELLLSKKFPAFIINIEMPFDEIDVNVHPSKTEVKFANDKEIFHAVYYAVKMTVKNFASNVNSFISATPTKEIKTEDNEEAEESVFSQTKIVETIEPIIQPVESSQPETGGMSKLFSFNEQNNRGESLFKSDFASFSQQDKQLSIEPYEYFETKQQASPIAKELATAFIEDATADDCQSFEQPSQDIEILGEAFLTYIICKTKDSIVFVDKHAAHERFLYDKLQKQSVTNNRQTVLEPVVVALSKNEKQALLDRSDIVEQAGFLIVDFGESEVSVREIPPFLDIACVKETVEELAGKLCSQKAKLSLEKEKWLLSSVACRAAIKAGHKTSKQEMEHIINILVNEQNIKYCPHGRPVIFKLSKQELEKRFGRTQ